MWLRFLCTPPCPAEHDHLCPQGAPAHHHRRCWSSKFLKRTQGQKARLKFRILRLLEGPHRNFKNPPSPDFSSIPTLPSTVSIGTRISQPACPNSSHITTTITSSKHHLLEDETIWAKNSRAMDIRGRKEGTGCRWPHLCAPKTLHYGEKCSHLHPGLLTKGGGRNGSRGSEDSIYRQGLLLSQFKTIRQWCVFK